MNIFDNNGKRFLLSPQQRRDLIEKFADSNEKVAREYLGRSDGRLFYSPPPDLNEPWEPYQGLSAKKIPWIFMQLPFAIFAQILFIGNSKVQKFRALFTSSH